MRMSVENLNVIRAWALRNQDAIPELTLRLVFATDLAEAVIQQESAPDPQRVIEVGYDIGNLMWRIRLAGRRGVADIVSEVTGGEYAAGTRVFLDAFRREVTDTAAVIQYIESKIGKDVYISEVIGYDPDLEMPEFGYRTIRIDREGDAVTFQDKGDPPCRPSRIKNLASSISKARRL